MLLREAVSVRRLCTACALLTALTFIGVSPARANPFGPEWGWWFNENDTPRFWYDNSADGNWQDAGEKARHEDLNPTDIDSSKVGLHENSDVAVYVGQYGTDWYGDTNCISPSGEVCHHWHVRFNEEIHQYEQNERRSTACHEYGHTVGLKHYENHQDNITCMEVPHWHFDYNAHDVHHINSHY